MGTKAKATDISSPVIVKQTPAFVKPGAASSSHSGGIVYSNGNSQSTATGVTASASSSTKPHYGMHSTGIDFVQTPGSKQNNRREGLTMLKQQSSTGAKAPQCHATHIVFDNETMDSLPAGYRRQAETHN